MRRLVLLTAVGALWLFLAALPALADGGPHVSAINNGSLGISADGCAGCHRAHTAQGPFLINAADEEALCLTCHGAASTGSTVDVMTGVQYVPAANGLRTATQLGATRNGGFDQARIDSSNAARSSYLRNATAVSQRPKVGVLATPQDVTSAHLALPDNGLTMPGVAWGNGAFSATANPGPVVNLSCGTCHNPHGNGQYRILNPIPNPAAVAPDVFTPVAAPGATVTDAPLPPSGDTRNYTVIQTSVQAGQVLLASEVVTRGFGPTEGDYFRRNIPWNPQVVDADCDPTVFPAPAACTVVTNNDAPNGQPATFLNEMTAWCSTCHSRYFADGNTPVVGDPYDTDSGDAIFAYRHPTRSNRTCTVCHVSHGSNAAMVGTFSSTMNYPDGTTSASSRLLKVDNRGTCQACHDPTGTIPAGYYVGPAPTPGVP